MLKVFSLYVIVFALLVLFIIFLNFRNIILFFVYSELLWMYLYLYFILLGSYFNDPRCILIGLLIFFIATVEIVYIGIYLSIRSK